MPIYTFSLPTSCSSSSSLFRLSSESSGLVAPLCEGSPNILHVGSKRPSLKGFRGFLDLLRTIIRPAAREGSRRSYAYMYAFPSITKEGNYEKIYVELTLRACLRGMRYRRVKPIGWLPARMQSAIRQRNRVTRDCVGFPIEYLSLRTNRLCLRYWWQSRGEGQTRTSRQASHYMPASQKCIEGLY